jgi:hypothetical protein
VICKCCLGKIGEDSNNGEKLSIIKLREAESFRARMRLVVAMRFQEQDPIFQLRTSSNTPSVSMNVA